MSYSYYFLIRFLGSAMKSSIAAPIKIPEIPIALNVYLQPSVYISSILNEERADPKYIPPFEIDVAVVLVSGGK